MAGGNRAAVYPSAKAMGAQSKACQQISADVKGVRRVTVRFTAEKEGVPFADEFIAGKEEDLDEHGHEHDHDHDHSHAEGHSSSTQVNGNANKRK